MLPPKKAHLQNSLAAELFDQREDHVGEYVRGLLLAKHYVKAALQLFSPTTRLQPDEKKQLNEYLAAILLIHDLPEVEAILPIESSEYSHKRLIKKAIEVYSQHHDPQVYLKQIPFRSHYREMRLILKAMYEGNEDKLLISQNSIYYQFVKLLQIPHQEPTVFWHQIKKLPPQPFEFISYLYGQQRAQLLNDLRTVNTPQQLFHVIINHSALLGEIYSKNACLRILPYYPEGIEEYQQFFAQLPDIEIARIKALAAEQSGDCAIEAWSNWVALRLAIPKYEILAELPKDINFISPHSYEIAVVLCHIFDLSVKMGYVATNTKYIQLLINSIRLDSSNKATYIKLMTHTAQNKKLYQHWVQVAVKQFPTDTEILLIGIQAAMANNAFKKAERFAKTLLKYDPIHAKAKQFLLFSYLSQARWQIKAKKYHLAQAILEQAKKIERVNQRRGLIFINQGWLSVLAGESEAAKRYFASAVQMMPEPIVQVICLIVEGANVQLTKWQMTPWLKQLTQFKSSDRLSIVATMQAIDVIKYYHEQSLPNLSEILQPVIKVINKSARYHQLTLPEVCTLCGKLAEIKLFKTLEIYAKQGVKNNSPLLVYYRILGKIAGDPRELIFDQQAHSLLTQALSEARSLNHTLAIGLITDLLKKYRSSYLLLNTQKLKQQFESAARELNINLDDIVPGSPEFHKLFLSLKIQ